jgi:hypothetical protein
MNTLFVAMVCWLAAQEAPPADPFRPRLVPSTRPPVEIEADGAGAAADDRQTGPDSSAPALPNPPSSEPAEHPGPEVSLDPQPATAPSLDSAADTTEAAPSDFADAPLSPVGPVPKQRLRPPELIAEALATPQEGGLQGAPLELVAALGRSPDRQQQLRIAQAYWQLSAAQAMFHWAQQERDLLDRFIQSQADAPAVQAARAAAAANVRDAQLDVAQAQLELADLIGTRGGELPLAVDRPHVGSYNTYFAEIFGGRPAPPQIRLIDRTLPIRRQAIDAHGAAVVAALDAVEATGQQFQASGQGLAALVSLCEQLHRQRAAFITAVRQYNDEIAQYLFAVVRPGTSEQALVSRLILTDAPSATLRNDAPRSRTFDQPQPLDRAPADRPPASGSVPPAVDAAPAQPAGTSEQPPAGTSEQPPAGAAPEQPGGTGEQPPPGAGEPSPAADSESRKANYQPQDVQDLLADGGGLYRGLADLRPPMRVQKLSGLLHWDRALPEDLGQATPLADCLREVPYRQRLDVLSAYWQARECAARYQVCHEQLEQLAALGTVVIALRDQPGMLEAGVRLHAARRMAKAALLEAHLALIAAQFRLTQAAGRSLDSPWLVPATLPQSGRYVVGDHGPGALRRAGQLVASRHAVLEDRSEAIVRADQMRASLGAQSQGHGAPSPAVDELTSLDQVVWAIGWQAAETRAFLRDLTEYNLAIARYALAVSPPEIASDELIRRLVIARQARGES